MRYQVPQFIERKTKIVGPLTFKQFVFVGMAVAVIAILYFTLRKTSMLLFILATIVVIGAGSSMAFVHIAGKSLPAVIINFFIFVFASKVYLWRKKRMPPKLVKLKTAPQKKKVQGPVLKIKQRSALGKLSTQIETKTR